jgi:hypothetical protein
MSLSDLKVLTKLLNWILTMLQNIWKIKQTPLFDLRRYNNVVQDLSWKETKYLKSSLKSTGVGPHMSECNKSNNLLDLLACSRKSNLCNLAKCHGSQLFKSWTKDKFKLCKISFDGWLNLLCQNWEDSALELIDTQAADKLTTNWSGIDNKFID